MTQHLVSGSNVFFAEKPQKSSATAYKHKDCSDAIRAWRFGCFCNIRLIEFGKCAESTSTTLVPSDHLSYGLDAHITAAGN